MFAFAARCVQFTHVYVCMCAYYSAYYLVVEPYGGLTMNHVRFVEQLYIVFVLCTFVTAIFVLHFFDFHASQFRINVRFLFQNKLSFPTTGDALTTIRKC